MEALSQIPLDRGNQSFYQISIDVSLASSTEVALLSIQAATLLGGFAAVVAR